MKEPSNCEEISTLLYQYLEAVEAGRDADAVLSELTAKAPHCESRLRKGIRLMREIRLHPGPAQEGFPDFVSEFKLLRRLGSGGMGVVFVAEQERLDRQIALKLVRPDQLLFGGAKERFHREIQSAARLSHPGIASVYEAGEYQGLPWLAQEYVRGASLDRVLSEIVTRFPQNLSGKDLKNALAQALQQEGTFDFREEFFQGTWVEVICRILQQVAEAVQHAHERGVLHRDLKPSNVILTPAGRAVLVDFGLANLAGTDNLTRSGTLIGSLAYMAPEQLDSKERLVSPRTDVYGLGVLLYELLTLRTPYSSGSVQRMRGLILEGDPPSPIESNGAVSKDVETICFCALGREPQRRYATAADFANDLFNVLAHRPIAARPTNRLQRTWRWTQRRPARALGMAFSIFVFVVAPTGFGIQRHFVMQAQKRLNKQLNSAFHNETEAHKATQRHRDAAIRTVEAGMRRFADYRLLDVEGASELRLEWIEEALEIFDILEKEAPGEFSILREKALLLQSRANALSALGRYLESVTVYESAVGRFQNLSSFSEFDASDYDEYGKTLVNLSWALSRLERMEEAVNHLQEAVRAKSQAMEAGADRSRLLADLSHIYVEMCGGQNQLGAWEEALKSAEKAREAARKAMSIDDQSPRIQAYLGNAFSVEANLYAMKGQFQKALQIVEQGLPYLNNAIKRDKENPRHQSSYAQGYYFAGLYCNLQGASEEAREYLSVSLEIYCELVTRFPKRPHFGLLYIGALEQFSHAAYQGGDLVEAVRVQREVLALNEKLIEDAPTAVSYRSQLGIAQANLAKLLMQLEGSEAESANETAFLIEAQKLAEAAILNSLPSFQSTPDSPPAQNIMAQIYVLAASLHVELDQFVAARADLASLARLERVNGANFYAQAEIWAAYMLAQKEIASKSDTEFSEEALAAMCVALKTAASKGHCDQESLLNHEVFAGFQEEPHFQRLLLELKTLKSIPEQ